MSMFRSAATAVLFPTLAFTGLACSPALAATCNLTVQGVSRLDDAACTVSAGRGLTRIAVGAGGTIVIRRQTMRVALAGDGTARRRHAGPTSYGQVVTSNESDDKTCYFNQRAVLCVEP